MNLKNEMDSNTLSGSSSSSKMTIVFTRPTWSRRQDIDFTKMNQIRAGIIPYYIDSAGTIYFCYRHDSNRVMVEIGGSKDIDDGDVEDTALRNCRDQTFGVFDISKHTLEDPDTMYLYDDKTVVIFVRLSESAVRNGMATYQSRKHRSLIWINDMTMSSFVSFFDSRMDHHLRCLLRDISKIIPLLGDSAKRESDKMMINDIEYQFEIDCLN